jgi:hypothetical protein
LAIWELDILDPFGVRKQTVNWYAADGTTRSATASGPAKGISNLSFHPRGSVLSAGGELNFTVPLDIQKNLGIAPPNMLQLRRYDVGVVGTYIVTERSHQPAGRYNVTLKCPDLAEELRNVLVPGYVASLTDDISSVGRALLAWQFETPWAFNALLNGFVGTGFSVFNQTIQQAIGQLASQRFCSWRLGNGRVIDFGRFGGTISGVRLQKVIGNRDPGPNVRRIKSIVPQEDASSVYNLVVATGGGSGNAAFDMSSIFATAGAADLSGLGPGWQISGPIDTTNFPGFDPTHPVMRRPLQTLSPSGFYQYFLYDHTSRARWRRKEYPLNQSNINPVSGEPLDVAAAAYDLYGATLSFLNNHKDPNYTYKITTYGKGSNVGLAGQMVRVDYDRVMNGASDLSIHQYLKVVEIETKVDDKDGSWEDVWTVSTTGQRTESNATAIAGALEKIDYWNAVPMTFPTRDRVWMDTHVDAQHPAVVPIDDDPAVLGTVQAIFAVSLLPGLSTIVGGAVEGHSHTVVIPSISFSPASVPATNEKSANPQSQGVHAQSGNGGQGANDHGGKTNSTSAVGTTDSGSAANKDANNVSINDSFRDHTHDIFIQSGGSPGSGATSGMLYWNPNGQSKINAAGQQGFANTTGVRNYGVDSTHNHTVSATGTGSAGTQGITNYGGFAPSVTSAGTGFQPDTNFPGYTNFNSQAQTVQTSSNVTPNWTPVYGYYQDPTGKPSNVFASVNGQVVGGPFNSDFSFDFTPYMATKQAYTLSFTSSTFGRLLIRGVLRQRETTVRLL